MRTLLIHGVGTITITFGFIYRGIGSGINDQLGLYLPNVIEHLLSIANIQLL